MQGGRIVARFQESFQACCLQLERLRRDGGVEGNLAGVEVTDTGGAPWMPFTFSESVFLSSSLSLLQRAGSMARRLYGGRLPLNNQHKDNGDAMEPCMEFKAPAAALLSFYVSSPKTFMPCLHKARSDPAQRWLAAATVNTTSRHHSLARSEPAAAAAAPPTATTPPAVPPPRPSSGRLALDQHGGHRDCLSCTTR